MIYPRATAIPRAIYAERDDPIATKPPFGYALDHGLHGRLADRQAETGSLNSDEVVTATCGYVQDGDNWEPWACNDATTCKTIAGSNFGCFSTVYTDCFPSTEWDTVTEIENRAIYCTSSPWTECVTGYKTFDDGVITGYICGVAELAGDNSVVDNTSAAETSTETTETTETTTSSTEITSGTTSGTETSSTSTSTQTGDNNGGSGTPVGAIVGGVVGGVAVIALVLFGIWLIHHKKKKAARNTQPQVAPVNQNPPPTSPAMTYNPTTPYSPHPPTYHSMSPITASPPPDAQGGYVQQGGYIPPQQTPPVKQEKHATATEMPTENYRTSGPPVELQ